MNEVENIAELASAWWSKVIQNPKFDNGDMSRTGAISSVISKMLVKKLNEDQISNFKQKLKEIILEHIKDDDYTFILGVDYGPCRYLTTAAEYAGVSINNFPIKTSMWISRNHLMVSYGYCAKREILYANKNYYLNRIKSCERMLRDYKHKSDDYFVIGTREELIKEIEDEMKTYQYALEELVKNES